MARVPLSGSASPRLSPGGVRVPSVGHMPFFLILVVALLFGLTPTAGASEARLEDDGTKLVVEPSGTPGIDNKVSISSTGPTENRRILVKEGATEGIGAPLGNACGPDGTAVSCPAAGVRVVDVTLGDGNDELTITGLDYPPGLLPREAFVIARGDAGNDTLIGGAGRDDLNGGAGLDTVAGRDGDDSLNGGDGPDTISGGDGNDTVDFSQRTQPLTISLDGVADDGEADERDNVLPDVEGVIGGSAGDTLTGSSAANFLDGRDGGDTLNGGAGNDNVSGGPGDDLLTGGEGEDKGFGGGGGDTLEGSTEDDELAGGTGADTVDGGGGNDKLYGGDLIIIGSDGPDQLIGGPGADRLFGGRGNDRLDGGLGPDYLSGESEKDTVTYEDRTGEVVVTLDGLANDGEADEGDNVLPDVEVILGGLEDDDLSGDAGDNTVEGGTGEDLIDGKLDPDRLLGGDRPDLVMARDGDPDEVACGDGRDLAIADREDEVIECETVDRPGSRRVVVGRYALLSPRREVGLRLPRGRRFFPLAQTVKIPIGSTIDPPEGGVVRLTTASDREGGRKLVSASGGPFTVRQRAGRRAVTRLWLSGRLPDCRNGEQQTARRARPPRKLRISEKGEGRVEVHGRYSIGGSFGTSWITEDRCDGTLTTVRRGAVRVRDLRRGRTVLVRPGHPYLAKKP
jgi:Ca2+-binding RTX toxin-like protein